jgi:uncharacterized protein YqhQ
MSGLCASNSASSTKGKIMHISPWTLYWILQLDSISTVLFIFTLLLGIAGIITSIIGACATSEYNYRGPDDEMLKSAKATAKAGYKMIKITVILSFILAFIPSTKTVAMVVVIPAVVNNEHVQKEAGDLYALAKEGLTKFVEDKESPAPAVEEKK